MEEKKTIIRIIVLFIPVECSVQLQVETRSVQLVVKYSSAHIRKSDNPMR